MAISLNDVRMGASFLFTLPSMLRHPLDLDIARAVLRDRMARREETFLDLLSRAVYGQPGSPYLKLLRAAGCEYGDVVRLVYSDGIEGTLAILFRQGVYVTIDEFKGRRPIRRGSTTVYVRPAQFQNPLTQFHFVARSSGSRGDGTPVHISLQFVRTFAVDTALVMRVAYGGTEWQSADWEIPGGGAAVRQVEFAMMGTPLVRWFSQTDPYARGLHPRYRWSVNLIRWGSLAAARPLPRPEYVPPHEPLPIIRWMSDVLRSGRIPHLYAFTSSAVRLCQAAMGMGIDLAGARFTLIGEPTTDARIRELRRAGTVGFPRYASIETGSMSYACLRPEAADDMHHFHDLQAFIQPAHDGPARGLPPSAVLITSLQPSAPVLLLNVSLGDQADLTRRACGCPLDALGWHAHIQHLRSFEKLTAAGMTFLDVDVVRVLEEVLPAQFGGSVADYQLVEEETSQGHPRLRLLVHPRVGAIDAGAVARAFLDALSGVDTQRVMAQVWRESHVLEVERGAPETTTTGKVLHVHLRREAPGGPLTDRSRAARG